MSGRGNRAEKREEKPVNPCTHCKERRPATKETRSCHCDCEKYLAFWAANRRLEEERRRHFGSDELLIRSVEKGIAIKRAMKGKMH